jgi:catechol 2,3-dioxygenase-like lactoylglutathione lyase family enzyme
MRFTHTHHMALFTTDLARLLTFYEDVLGCPRCGAFPGLNIVFVNVGSTAIEIVEIAGPAGEPATGGWAHLALEVPDVDAACAELSALGVSFHVPPKDFPDDAPSVRIAFFRDPDGNVLELVQPLRSRYPEG